MHVCVGPTDRTLGGSRPEHRTGLREIFKNGNGKELLSVRPSAVRPFALSGGGHQLVGLGSMECLDLLPRCRSIKGPQGPRRSHLPRSGSGS